MMLSLLMVMTMKVKIAIGKSLLNLSKQDLPYLTLLHLTNILPDYWMYISIDIHPVSLTLISYECYFEKLMKKK